MKHVFICSTPSHLINTINLSLINFKDEQITLYLLDHSKDYHKMYQKAIESGCFVNIFLLKTNAFNNYWLQKFKFTRYISKAIEYIFYKNIATRFIDDTTIYDKFWVSFMDRSSWLLFMSYKKKNPSLELLHISDGMGGYRLLTVRQNRFDEVLLHILGFKSPFEEMKALYVYEPTLVKNTRYPSIKIEPLPKITDHSMQKLLNDILSFSRKDMELLKHKYIFLEAPYGSKKIYDHQLKIMDYLGEKLGKAFCVKPHPRTQLNAMNDNLCVSDVFTAIEALCLNGNVSGNVFVSGLSAASVMPKLMFDQEPVVIFLYKIFGLDKMTFSGDGYIEFMEDFTKTYVNSNRVFIPETIEEMEDIIKILEGNNNGI